MASLVSTGEISLDPDHRSNLALSDSIITTATEMLTG